MTGRRRVSSPGVWFWGAAAAGRSAPGFRPELPENRYSRHDSLPALCGTVRTMSRQLPVMVQVLEKIDHGSVSQTGESKHRIRKKASQDLVHGTPHTTMVRA